ncbi:FAD-dependent oxidoreductase [Streptosporangium sp. NBC_01755]|uniref:FAD-dependent oxidoreductase n=1 Tax=unclassified Streptosporangium TaxID=2632669 RepID=UPI002DDC5877|nr:MULTISPECIES: FAD-dependent oxidoreductase [unclassified Streptosporangium]WSA26457.1 FAD-dependent oxidoreductase [Streptosporangium sp. NBC_01810]WSD02113.1 FAD-dependent oxidoreductase [Streptosporangium sp. NBC_01755]
MTRRIIVIGGGAAGMGAAGAAKGTDPDAEVIVFTDYEDAAYSPCGIPYVHGREISSFESLFMATKQHYVEQGIDIRYETTVAGIDVKAKTVTTTDGTVERYDSLVLATGFTYADPGVPGGDLGGIYYVKNIRQAMEWDKVLDTVKTAVVDEATPLGAEMVTALAHRGIETHLVDPAPWAMSSATDPDIIKPVEDSWIEMGAKLHFNTKVTGFIGESGKLREVATSQGNITADLAVVATKKTPNTALATAAGLKTGMSGGLIVDGRMRTSAPDVYAAGDCTEIPHGVSNVPIQGLSGSHAYSQGKVAGVNAAGGTREYRAVYVPWGMVAGKWMIGGVSFSETLATALGIPFIVGNAQGISRARYYPDVKPVKVKLLAEPEHLRLIGAQLVGGEGIKERADFLAMAVRTGITLNDLATMENVYSPPIGALNEPIALAAQNALTKVGA